MLALQLPVRARRPARRLPAFRPETPDGDWLTAIARPDLTPAKKLPVPVASPVVARLDANELPFALPEAAARELGATLADVALNRYGDDATGTLRRILCDTHGVAPDQICFGHGSYELIGMLVAAFSRPRAGATRAAVLYPTPTFFGYRAAAVVHGAEPVEVPLRADLELDAVALERALVTRRPNVAFFCRPNNPTGNSWPLDTLVPLTERHPHVLFVIDEVYCAYAGESWLDSVSQRPNVVVLRSISKVGGAGVRVGYAAGPSDVIDRLERARPPFTVNSLSAAAAAWLLTRGAAHTEESVRTVVSERARLTAALARLPGVTVFASQANFVLLRVANATPLWQRLREQGILVSNFDMPGVLAGCLRVTVGTPAENDLFLTALRRELCQE